MKRVAHVPRTPPVAPGTDVQVNGNTILNRANPEDFEAEAVAIAAKLGFEGDPDEQFGAYYLDGIDPTTNRVRKVPANAPIEELGLQSKTPRLISGLTVRDAQLYLRKCRHEAHQAHLNGLEPPTAQAIATHLGLDKVEDASEVLATLEAWLEDVAKAELAG